MMRQLRGHVMSMKFKENPSSLSDLDVEMRAKVLAQKLQSLGFAPSGGYTVSFDAQGIRSESIPIDDWLVYLTYMIPYVEELGVE